MDFRKQYYDVLGIPRTASAEEMRAAYRSLVKQYHPDRNPSPEAAERIKEINEAYEVLSNPEKRKIYDGYEKTKDLKDPAADTGTQKHKESRRRTYERKFTVQKTEKLFIWGQIFIKFCADSVGQLESLTEKNYAIFPTNTEVVIRQNGIFREPSAEYVANFEKSVPLHTNLSQPILCRIDGIEEEWYKLNLEDIRILNPKLTNVVKHDAQSFGTLEAEVFAYIIKVTEEEKTERVTECYGETGKRETRLEDGWYWKRTEYYKPDCSTYWGDWVTDSPERTTPYQRTDEPRPASTERFSSTGRRWSSWNYKSAATPAGCVNWLWIPLLMLFVAAIPQLGLPLLILGALWLLIRFGQGLLARSTVLFSLLFVGIVAAAIAAAFRNNYAADSRPIVQRQTTREEDMPRRVDVWKVDESADSTVASENEEYISHLVKWVSYDSTPYQVVLSARVTDIQSSSQFHSSFQISSEKNAWREIFTGIEQKDYNGLHEVHAAFDSIRQVNGLNERQFSEMMVSAVQSIPYFLVTSNDCETAGYSDPFVRDFLKSCQQGCCVGNAKFGIRSPLEFLNDLKGDCDTRALFLYSMLKHFGFDVALMTSEHYRHAAIAVHFKDQSPIDGTVIQINGKNYYPWETTNKGFLPGVLPEQCNNLNYWNIALVNQ
ncbi:J domain-containing protein [Terrimonas ginsenosidimutans]|uniref:J domain-containing protein n=1 Tax=Terrimonas ginsenosidimutans TaxID=2908004 RepID=UPI00254641B0|nr:DnaJ domain-containing protein [Terrimonas ginsenosidimutans]